MTDPPHEWIAAAPVTVTLGTVLKPPVPVLNSGLGTGPPGSFLGLQDTSLQ